MDHLVIQTQIRAALLALASIPPQDPESASHRALTAARLAMYEALLQSYSAQVESGLRFVTKAQNGGLK